MGDVRFERPYDLVREASDRTRALRNLTDEEVVQALAASSRAGDPLMANILATEAANRIQRLRAALASMDEGVVVIGPDLDIRWLNPAAESLLGVKRDEVMFEPFEEVFAHLDSEGEPVDPARCPILRAVGGESGRSEGDRLRTRDGREICIAYTSAPIVFGEGSPQGAVLAFEDCGERVRRQRELRESRERYKSLFDGAEEGVVSIGLDGRIVDANPAAERMTQRPISESRGEPFTQFLHPDDVERAMRLFADLLSQRARETELRIRHRDGTYFPVKASGVPVVLDGEVIAIHGRMRPLERAPNRSESRAVPALGL